MASIVLVGATGLIGRQLLDLLLERGDDVTVLTRRATGATGANLREQVADSGEWPQLVAAAKPEVVISCLGTTWAKAGKSEAAFRAVDQQLVEAVMKAARNAGATRAITVSSVGANAHSRNFYLRVKGEVEESLQAMGFDRIDVLRPGLLRGERGSERRFGERIGIILSPLTDIVMSMGPLRRYRSIDSATVAKAIGALSARESLGTFVHENDGIRRLAVD